MFYGNGRDPLLWEHSAICATALRHYLLTLKGESTSFYTDKALITEQQLLVRRQKVLPSWLRRLKPPDSPKYLQCRHVLPVPPDGAGLIRSVGPTRRRQRSNAGKKAQIEYHFQFESTSVLRKYSMYFSNIRGAHDSKGLTVTVYVTGCVSTQKSIRTVWAIWELCD